MVFKENLNKQQLEAIEYGNGPLLILAGAGSGKTTVLTYRIAYLIKNNNIPLSRILAVTFTNKAANEMKIRIEKLLSQSISNIWIGTFHSICNRILHTCIDKIGISKNFTIFDEQDQLSVINECLKEANLPESPFLKPKFILTKISKAKSLNLDFDTFFKNDYSGLYTDKICEIAKMYQKKLRKANALDFDDILLYTLYILKEDKEVREYYQNKFKYILVDEYQDTNQVQYEIVKILSDIHKNLNVVGDVDQSIYSFRNADFRIILRFVDDFPSAKIIKLEENYRSTQTILNAANSIIKYNINRYEKVLYTNNTKGSKINIYNAYDEEDEAIYVYNEIKKLLNKGYNYNDIAILYRTNAQSRAFEEVFVKYRIPYQIIGGLKFYDRKEVKDILAYLKIINNPHDNISLKRIINTPKRGIGDTTIAKIEKIADNLNMSIWQLLENIEEIKDISKGAKLKIKEFIVWLKNLKAKNLLITDLIHTIFKESGYEYLLTQENSEESWNRIENIKALISSANEFEKNFEDSSLNAFLNQIALISDIDNLKENKNNVLLMTIHNAKGLEFPVVFLVGLEEGKFPHILSIKDKEQLEEERRLMYVAVTRAKKELFFTYAKYRYDYNYSNQNKISRFVKEVPDNLFNICNNYCFRYGS